MKTLSAEDYEYLKYVNETLKGAQERVTQIKPAFDEAVAEMKRVEGGIETLWGYLQKKYNLKPSDTVNIEDGSINRSEPEVDKNRID
jgi:hypothetical protein